MLKALGDLIFGAQSFERIRLIIGLSLSFSLVHFLLDEIVASTIHRCLDPTTMEPSVSCHLSNIFQQTEEQFDCDAAVLGIVDAQDKLEEPAGLMLDIYESGFIDPEADVFSSPNSPLAQYYDWKRPEVLDSPLTSGSLEVSYRGHGGSLARSLARSIDTLQYKGQTGSLDSIISVDTHPRHDLDQVFLKPLAHRKNSTWIGLFQKQSASESDVFDLFDNECFLLSDDESLDSDDSFERLSQISSLPDDDVLILYPKTYFNGPLCYIL